MTSPLALASYLTLGTALLFGGAARRDVPSDYVPEFIALPLLALALPGAFERLRREPLTLAILAGLLALLLLHLVPLPAFVWSALPGREIATASYDAAVVGRPVLPLSMQPQEALKGGLALIPAFALFLAAVNLGARARRALVIIALAIGVVSLPLGILQILGGVNNSLYFFAITNNNRAVGFFANANHYAAFFYVLIPLGAAVFAERRRIQGVPCWTLMVALTIICILGLAVSGSRSALALGALSLGLSGWFLMRRPLQEVINSHSWWLIAAPMALGVLMLASAMGLSLIIGRFDGAGSVDDARMGLFAATWDLIWRYSPTGSGLGTFEKLYEVYAPGSPGGGQVANHAHNDYAEIAMEAGLPGIALIGAFFVWFARRARAAFVVEPDFEGRLGMASVIAVALLCIHSAWDYPLRTIALSSLFGLCAAFLFVAPADPAASAVRHRKVRRDDG
ncbi:MAG: O-antigen ligase family protein [Beijerinckiaceae bacterium]